MDDELSALRQKKLEQLQSRQQKSNEHEQLAAQIQQLEAQIKPLFTKEALMRYSTIKAAHQEKAVQVLVVVAQLAQRGMSGQIDDAALKKILQQLSPQKRETQFRGI